MGQSVLVHKFNIKVNTFENKFINRKDNYRFLMKYCQTQIEIYISNKMPCKNILQNDVESTVGLLQ